MSGRWAQPRRILDAAYDVTISYGYRPIRVLWLLAILIILVTGTFLVPGAEAAMRATSPTGTVYTPQGALAAPGAVPATASGSGTARSASATADACGGGQVLCFSPFLYAIDTVVPLISLDQRSTWHPDARAPAGALLQWWLNAATVLGWLLSSVFVLSLANLARSV